MTYSNIRFENGRKTCHSIFVTERRYLDVFNPLADYLLRITAIEYLFPKIVRRKALLLRRLNRDEIRLDDIFFFS